MHKPFDWKHAWEQVGAADVLGDLTTMCCPQIVGVLACIAFGSPEHMPVPEGVADATSGICAVQIARALSAPWEPITLTLTARNARPLTCALSALFAVADSLSCTSS